MFFVNDSGINNGILLMKPIDDRNLGGTVKMEAFYIIKELDSLGDKIKNQ